LSRKVFLASLWAIWSLSVFANTGSDESAIWSLFVCERMYQELDWREYDKEQQDLIQLREAVIAELNKKYSKRDADLMQSKVSKMAASVENKKNYRQFCSDTMNLLQQRKIGPLKSYLLPD
jgi:hypothetical protein